MAGSQLINLGELSRPATVLVEKISDAVGGAFRPYQIVRVAKAEAEAEQIRAESRIKVTEIEKRAMLRFLEEEGKRQANIESITQKALPLLDPESSPDKMSDDWITNFFDKSRIVSDSEMQQLWSRVLAGEANLPGSFSRRTVNLIADLEKRNAESFESLCRFGWRHKVLSTFLFPLVVDVRNEIYRKGGLSFGLLSNLESLGLLKFDIYNGFTLGNEPRLVELSYFGSTVQLTLPDQSPGSLSLGEVIFTDAGQELAQICTPQRVEGFVEYMLERWEGKNLKPRVLQ